MNIIKNPSRKDWPKILARPTIDLSQLDKTVNIVFDEVKSLGDRAVKKNTKQFDGVEINDFLVSEAEFAEADKLVPKNLRNAIEIAKNNIEKFHTSQREEVKMVETIPGVTCWRESKPIECVGLYIPGGSAPLFSTVLMLAVPAKIAGCKEIILCSPPDKNGKVHPAILYTAKLAGVNKVFKVGGIQAIAAMSYGTETIPKAHKIFGPGNQYVTAAKRYCMHKGIAIDMPAGPSEVLVFADETADPDFMAADLLAQAEHGNDSQVILITQSESYSSKVVAAVKEQMKGLPRLSFVTASLQHARIIIMDDKKEIMDLINFYAPEHLIIAVEDEGEYMDEITNAGSVFLGHYTPESAGDYASGTNHTLPTNGYAKSYSGVSLDSFVKKITFQRISPKGLQSLGPSIELMAEAEGLQAHKNAVSVRLKKLNRND